ncbi:EAL and modified HD-GYP domain-containing signal transduction protein [Desulfobaculum xiamenense]|uniref:EAL and modified HD-GYP domain-containing signal transduction protein n=1 Tax=Desulfobaculum xiamenense TaxID=995050 RepID=A0A846QJ21_9BACT|nr:HDOD domain-containing protein [Desulfobaculum xiamenense]NJB68866.1 EAL and modified HD-GYP domain-containing signal transduction protein [Desulfobaculum xiamenense]
MHREPTTSNNVLATFFTRQPIFATDYTVWGYELVFSTETGRELDELLPPAPTDAGARFTATSLCEAGKTVLIDFRQNALSAMPPGKTVIVIPDQPMNDDLEMVFTLLKRRGYAVAIDTDESFLPQETSVRLADFVLIDTIACDARRIEAIREHCQNGSQLVARHVQDRQHLAEVRAAGCVLFSGPFFAVPENLDRRELTSHESSRFQLLEIIERAEEDFDELSAAIRNDAALSYRLLTYLNSAAFSFPERINSIKQAVVILGWKQLSHWLRIIVFTDLNPDIRTEELLITALKRAKFFEILARAKKSPDFDPDQIFLLGLFSMLESILEMPMNAIVARLPLSQELRDALLGAPSPHRDWLDMVNCYELAGWERLESIVAGLGFDFATITNAYNAALAWADAFTRHSSSA